LNFTNTEKLGNLQLLSEMVQETVYEIITNISWPRRIPLVEKKNDCHFGAPVIRVARSLVFFVVLYRPLFVFLAIALPDHFRITLRTKFDIYVFITITGSIPLLVDY